MIRPAPDSGNFALGAVPLVPAPADAAGPAALSGDLFQAVFDALPTPLATLDAGGRILAANAVWRGDGVMGPAGPNPLPGVNYLVACAAATHLPDAAAAAAGIGDVLAAWRPEFVLEYVAGTPAGPRWCRLLAVPLPQEGGAVVLLDDITPVRQAEAALRHYGERLDLLHALEHAVHGAQPPAEVARTALRYVRGFATCTWAAVVLCDGARQEATVLAAEDAQGRMLTAAAAPSALAECSDWLAGEIRVSEDPKNLKSLFAALRLPPHGARALVSVPLRTGAEVVGVLLLALPAAAAFGPDQATACGEIANRLGLALHAARLFEQVQAGRKRLQLLSARLIDVQESERLHLARELHDEIGQDLTALKLSLHAAGAASDAAARGLALDDALAVVDRLQDEVRNLSLDLRPALLDDLGLASALRSYLDHKVRRSGLDVHFTAEPSNPPLRPDLATACFRVAQEALTNVLRHAGARRVEVTLTQSAVELQLRVRDDGAGFDARAIFAGAAPEGRLGLLGMQERVSLLGGLLTVDSVPGQGTTIAARLPLVMPGGPGRRAARPPPL